MSTTNAITETLPIVIASGDPREQQRLDTYLTQQGWSVLTTGDGKALRRLLAERPVAAVVLDAPLPDEDGLSLIWFLRQHDAVGILMLSASPDPADRIIGLEMGADDYLTHPYQPRELAARLKSVVRRVAMGRPEGTAASATQPACLPCGAHLLDLASRTLVTREGREVLLTEKEFTLLKAFAEHPDRALSRDQLLDMSVDCTWESLDRSIDLRVARLRRKVEADPAKPQLIKTVRGVGYMFVQSRAA